MWSSSTASGASATSGSRSKTEKIFSAEATAGQNAIAAESAALARRIAALETHKFACGTYTGNTNTYGGSQTIKLPFTPKAVIVAAGVNISLADKPTKTVKIVSGGFTVYYMINQEARQTESANTKGNVYTYLAFC